MERLLNSARQFDQHQRQGLYRFLQYVKARTEEELDEEPAPVSETNAVRLMSIHQSKGLQFPIVVVANLGHKFNTRDLSKHLFLSEDYGLCAKVQSPATRPLVFQGLAKLAGHPARNAFKLRVRKCAWLYVAFTRPCDLLILAGCASGKDPLKKWSESVSDLDNPEKTAKVSAALDWIGRWICADAHPALPDTESPIEQNIQTDLFNCQLHASNSSFENAFTRNPDTSNCPDAKTSKSDPLDTPGIPPCSPVDPTERLGQELAAIDESPLKESVSNENASVTESVSEKSAFIPDNVLESLKSKLNWAYPFETTTREPAKSSVSALKRRAMEWSEETRPLFAPPSPIFQTSSLAAKGLVSGNLTSAEIGTAHHSFLQWVNLGHCQNTETLKKELERIQNQGALSKNEAETIRMEDIADFWNSPVGKEVLQQAQFVQREWPFTVRFSMSELRQLGIPLTAMDNGRLTIDNAQAGQPNGISEIDDFILVQGVVDLAVVLPDQIWLLDYKTDRVTEENIDDKVNDYRPQIALYCAALQKVIRRPVTRAWLQFLYARKTIEIKR